MKQSRHNWTNLKNILLLMPDGVTKHVLGVDCNAIPRVGFFTVAILTTMEASSRTTASTWSWYPPICQTSATVEHQYVCFA